MKKFLLLISSLTCLLAVSSLKLSAQTNNESLFDDPVFRVSHDPRVLPGRISYRNGKLYDSMGNLIRPEIVRYYIGDQIYDETYTGARKQFRAGKTLALVGIPTLIAGSCLMFAWICNFSEGFNTVWLAGTILGYAGSVCVDVGVPLWIIGSKRLKWVASDYNSRLSSSLDRPAGSRPCPYVSTSSTGIGLALNF